MPDQLAPSTDHPTFLTAVRVWAKIGLLSFGGPAGQIALMHKELVETRKWVSEARFLNALNYCMLLPGPEAQQLATYIGWVLHGAKGGIAAGTLFVAPGFIVILTLSILYADYHQTEWLGHIFFGLKAGVIAIVIEAVLKVGRRALRSHAMIAIAAVSFLAIYCFHVPFPVIVIVAAATGFLGTFYRIGAFKQLVQVPSQLGAGIRRPADGDGAQRPSFRSPIAVRSVKEGVSRAVRLIVLWGGVWLAPVGLAVVVLGPDSGFAEIGGFFARLAVVTFGGAYAVLAYVSDVAVTQFHWLRPGEMLDGLALAETTPGPLLLVLPFVGFQAAFRLDGPFTGLTAGILGAALVTWVTFVPSFLWIFLGGPYIEGLSGQRSLGGALAAITAAVVGVILNLALWFALHTLFYDLTFLSLGPFQPTWPLWTTVDLKALALAAIAIGLVFRVKFGTLPTLAVCGTLGWVLKLIT